MCRKRDKIGELKDFSSRFFFFSFKTSSVSSVFVNIPVCPILSSPSNIEACLFSELLLAFFKGALALPSYLKLFPAHVCALSAPQVLSDLQKVLFPLEMRFHSSVLNFAYLVRDIGALERLDIKLGVDCPSQLRTWSKSLIPSAQPEATTVAKPPSSPSSAINRIDFQLLGTKYLSACTLSAFMQIVYPRDLLCVSWC